MDWLPIAAFILIGLVLIIVEIIFVPGTTVVGIAGFLCMGYGIYQSYALYGNSVGTLTLVGSLLVSALLIYFSFRNRSWERFSLKSEMTGKVNEGYGLNVKVGDRGQSVSSLKPIGKALFDDEEVEVRSNGGYVEENQEIEVLRVEGKRIFVKPVKN